MIAHGIPIYVPLEPVDMRFGFERLRGLVREKMQAEPRSRALFAFVGKRGRTMKVPTWDGTGVIMIHKNSTCHPLITPTPPHAADAGSMPLPGPVNAYAK